MNYISSFKLIIDLKTPIILHYCPQEHKGRAYLPHYWWISEDCSAEFHSPWRVAATCKAKMTPIICCFGKRADRENQKNPIVWKEIKCMLCCIPSIEDVAVRG